MTNVSRRLTKTGKPSHAKNPNARKKKPILHFEQTYTSRPLSEIMREYNRILTAQTPDEVDNSYEALIS